MGDERLIGFNRLDRFSPQREWVEGRGIFLWLAFFFTEIGSGIYFVSLFLDYPKSRLLGWIVALILGGLLHLGFLEKPFRSWRIFLRPQSSELSRGLWAILFFAIIGFFQVVPVVIPVLPWTGENLILKFIMGILCVLLITHGYMTMGGVRALPLWNTSMTIPMVLASSILVGSQAIEIWFFFIGRNMSIVEIWARWSLIGYIALLAIFLWGVHGSSDNGRKSVERLFKGEASLSFYTGVITIGILIPLIITFYIWNSDIEQINGGILITRIICLIIGDLSIRYNILKCALYSPLTYSDA